jgi:hypothetical protein
VTVVVGCVAARHSDRSRREVGVVVLQALVDVAAHALAAKAAGSLDVVRAALDAHVVHVDADRRRLVDPRDFVERCGGEQLAQVELGFDQHTPRLLMRHLDAERAEVLEQALLVGALVGDDEVAELRAAARRELIEQSSVDAVGRMVGADPAHERQLRDPQGRGRIHFHEVRAMRQESFHFAAQITNGLPHTFGRLVRELHDV